MFDPKVPFQAYFSCLQKAITNEKELRTNIFILETAFLKVIIVDTQQNRFKRKVSPKQHVRSQTAFLGLLQLPQKEAESHVDMRYVPRVNHTKRTKEFKHNNLARNIPQIPRDCGLNGLRWQTRIGRIRDWDQADCNFEHHSLPHSKWQMAKIGNNHPN